VGAVGAQDFVDGTSITVMLPKIARKTLGLADGSFQRIEIEAHSLVLKGQGITRSVRLPVSMLGTYHSDILNNLFLYLQNNSQNGVLGVTTGPLTKAIFFKRGHIVFGGSTDATDRIGNFMLRLGMITDEQLQSVSSHDDPRRFGVRVRDAGFITHEQLWEALRVQTTSICCSLVDFPVGTYFFLPSCVPNDAFNHFVIEPTEVLFQGMIEMDERHRRLGYDAEEIRSSWDVLAALGDD